MQIMLILILLTLGKKIRGQTYGNGTKNAKILVPLKYLSNFCGTLEMSIINCEINLDLKCAKQLTMEIKAKHF